MEAPAAPRWPLLTSVKNLRYYARYLLVYLSSLNYFTLPFTYNTTNILTTNS